MICCKKLHVVIISLVVILLSGCLTQPVRSGGVTDLATGIQILGENLFSKVNPFFLNKVVITLQSFEDADTADKIQASYEIEKLLLNIGQQKFSGVQLLSLANSSKDELEGASYIIRGAISYEIYPNIPSKKYYRIAATLADIKTGSLIAHEEVWVNSVPYGNQGQDLVIPSSADPNKKKQVQEILQKKNIVSINDILVEASVAKAEEFYRKKDYIETKNILVSLVQNPKGKNLSAYRLLYVTNIRLNNIREAKIAYGEMLKLGFENNRKLEMYFLFESGKTDFLTSRAKEFNDIWITEIAEYFSSNPHLCPIIIGHSSKQGDAEFNKKLSLRRSDYIKSRLLKEKPELANRVSSDGKGEEETKVGTEPDSDQNQKDRRVEIEVSKCT